MEYNGKPTRETIVFEMPASRRAFFDWYSAPQNKGVIYYVALFLWMLNFSFMQTILPQTGSSAYRVAFYLPLVIHMSLLCLTTHFLIRAALNYYYVTHIQVRDQPLTHIPEYPLSKDSEESHIVEILNHQ